MPPLVGGHQEPVELRTQETLVYGGRYEANWTLVSYLAPHLEGLAGYWVSIVQVENDGTPSGQVLMHTPGLGMAGEGPLPPDVTVTLTKDRNYPCPDQNEQVKHLALSHFISSCKSVDECHFCTNEDSRHRLLRRH